MVNVSPDDKIEREVTFYVDITCTTESTDVTCGSRGSKPLPE